MTDKQLTAILRELDTSKLSRADLVRLASRLSAMDHEDGRILAYCEAHGLREPDDYPATLEAFTDSLRAEGAI